ncbi:ABC transporter ATP-binding protein [Nocardia puris]|uniref:NitT/TauT family transport system ATP-binding protein n=1 Tax=Nocardia puris TaxID=208602 RepID=A0A366DIW9_9NOCA|nr:ABC transporter ATP-binding protein [Nocardia puris]RBO89449.1 NitT/TauT family transport system ATP-binding protein [Nocardia puris]
MTGELRAEHLTVRFPGRRDPVLRDVSLRVPAGSITVLAGPSGCGKSTLLDCFAGLLTPSDGAVTEDGVPITGPDRRRGVVFQRDVLFPWCSVRANLGFALAAAGVPRRERAGRVAELLRTVHLSADVARRHPHELSGGMRQRVGVARMLACAPEVMLMDEPFAALDAQTRLHMQDLVLEIWAASARTVVFVTHDVDEAIRLGDRVVVLGDGGVRAELGNPLPRPRPADRLAELPGYSEMRRTLHHHIGGVAVS